MAAPAPEDAPEESSPKVISEADFASEIEKQAGTPKQGGRPFAWILQSRFGTSTFLFVIVVGLALIFFLGFALITAFTIPTPELVESLMPSAGAVERIQAYKDLRTAWLQQTTNLGQMFVFGSVIPVLSTIIGYSLGNQSRD
jgi:hypothetical protein